ncbi:hypothetical protein A1F94_012721 [Pyrenophora tritici-repentis]|nr:hypothetical protein A1F94_012721 [Pyrenophora tritici-repentis]
MLEDESKDQRCQQASQAGLILIDCRSQTILWDVPLCTSLYIDLEATEIDQTKFGKMAMFEGINRPPTPYIQEEEFYKLARQINQLLRHLNKANIEYACEEPNIMAAMRQDFYRLSLE